MTWSADITFRPSSCGTAAFTFRLITPNSVLDRYLREEAGEQSIWLPAKPALCHRASAMPLIGLTPVFGIQQPVHTPDKPTCLEHPCRATIGITFHRTT